MGLTVTPGGAVPPVRLVNADPTATPFSVVGAASQTAPLLLVETSNGTDALEVTANGTSPIARTAGRFRSEGLSAVGSEWAFAVGDTPLLFGFPAGSVVAQFINATGRYASAIVGRDSTHFAYLEYDNNTLAATVGAPNGIPLLVNPNNGGVRLGNAAGQIGFYGAVGVVRAAAPPADPGTSAIYTQAWGDAIRARQNAIVTAMQNLNLTA